MIQRKRGRPSKFWTDEREQKLRDMNARGATDGEIAKAFGVTRNTIIGKRQRLDIPTQKPRGALTLAQRRERKIESDRKRRQTHRIVKPKVIKAAPPTEPAAIGPLDDIAAAGCRWIHGDPRTPGWRMCGHEQQEGQPYCPFHHARAFTPARRAEAA